MFSSAQALCVTCVFAGWTVASPFWGWTCDRLGRRKVSESIENRENHECQSLLVASTLGGLAGCATALSPSFPVFVIARVIVGIALGATTQSLADGILENLFVCRFQRDDVYRVSPDGRESQVDVGDGSE